MKVWWRFWMEQLDRRWFLWSMLVINALGSVYGFYWYHLQLQMTEGWQKLFVPDSPTASTLFTLVLLLYIIGRRSPLLEALAAVTLFKYGIWAVAMILLSGWVAPAPFFQALHWTDWMLMTSHLGMAAEAVLYSRFFTYRLLHLILAGVWVLLNDALDYGLDIHPWLPPWLQDWVHPIAVFTVGLSVVSLALFARLGLVEQPERKWELPRMFDRG
ncbi:DUF1405 domain-containing protein [Polycladomyces subterraneus]|jgi:uncharacterized membrane protein YpjA|uniref:DUF1405 domain-containing protein n=1 Tax=Polycladomyces subterraneus TaxID=1016997 RepID=A0ABT8IN62_9BACL|nr:DUF1405 domain-containing protein [Polycladomyces subterraneus]MDN4594248.1 DUF1405 domain-containing protein [Polycladomyces subterraneus]